MERQDPLTAFGANVKSCRKKLNISQEKLAELSELDRTYVSSLERGLRNVGVKKIVKLADALCIAPPATKDFMVWKKQNPRRKIQYSLAGKSDTPCRKNQLSETQMSENPATLGQNTPETVSENPAIYTSNHMPNVPDLSQGRA
jgi:transcriptional regulator with XRE-family HTH domain